MSRLLPVVVQDADDGKVLMLAWANQEALDATDRTGEAHFWSRSRNELWHKGATSGNRMPIVEVARDCDADAILYRVRPLGPACHTGDRSCFRTDPAAAGFDLADLERVIADRRTADPAASYTARLIADGPRRAAEKVVEEAGETAGAAMVGSDAEVRAEAADLAYHLLVLLAARNVPFGDVLRELAERHRAS